jgi:hypothetical protein
MPEILDNSRSNTNPNGENGVGTMTPDLINKISDLVYHMLMEDLKIEKERIRNTSNSNTPGGW